MSGRLSFLAEVQRINGPNQATGGGEVFGVRGKRQFEGSQLAGITSPCSIRRRREIHNGIWRKGRFWEST